MRMQTPPVQPIASAGEARQAFYLRRQFRPLSELVAGRPHGDRLRYAAGCRCEECRKANTDYARARTEARRRGEWNGVVLADRARAHILALSQAGVGRRAISDVTNLDPALIAAVRTGRKTKIRAINERLILAVTPDMGAENSLVPAAPTWSLIKELLKAGFTKGRIARELNGSRLLQLSKNKVTLRNAAAIARIHRRLINSDEVLIPAKTAIKQLATLREEGFTEKQLARALEWPDEKLPRIGNVVKRGLAVRLNTLYRQSMT